MTKNNSHLIICNGELPSKKVLKKLLTEHNYILCADGGANHAKANKINPNIIIGDFDSILPATKKYFKKVKQIKIEDQNSTDLEKSLSYLLKEKILSATIIGATGKRIDHTLANFSILLKFHKKGMKLKIVEDDFEIFVATGRANFKTKIGQLVSIVPLIESSGISTDGLKYSLKHESLTPGVREGVSNVAVKNNVSIVVTNGALIILIKTKK